MSENIFYNRDAISADNKMRADEASESQHIMIDRPSEKEVVEYLCQLEEDYNCGKIRDLEGNEIWNMDHAIMQNGLLNLTENQWAHGAVRMPHGEPGLEKLENILAKVDVFTGDFGPIAGTALSKVNNYPNAWEGGRFVITRNDDSFYDVDGSLNITGIEIILSPDFEPYGKYLASKYQNIVFKDASGKVFQL